MKKNYIVVFIFIMTSISQTLNGEVPEFKKIIEEYLSVKTIKASITQQIYLQNGSTEVFSGNYFAASKGFIRIDYIRPERQVVVVNDSGLFWYYSDRKILFLSEKKKDKTGTIPVLMNIIPSERLIDVEVVRQGVKFYSLFQTAEVYSITSKKNNTKMIIWVNPLSKIIKRKYILDESDREIMKEDYIEHVLINGISIPSIIELKARTSEGVIHTLTKYSNIVINTGIDKDLFKFKVTPDMKVRILSDR